MALMQLTSNNPKLSFIIKKNPASGMNIMEHKSGHLFGWYSPNCQTYNVWFKDKLKANSYGDQDFNNTLQYSSPMFVLDGINNFFTENLKKHHEADTREFTNTLTVNLVAFAQTKILNNFIAHFTDYHFTVTEIGHCKKISITTNKSIHELINLTALLFALFELRKTDIYVDASLLQKYIHCLNRVNAPYFVRYLFKMYLLRNGNDFKEVQPILEDNGKYQLTFGDNYLARVRATESVINFDLPVVDIGCGEGKFLKFLSPKVPKYLAVDKDLEVLKSAEAKVKRDELTNVFLFSDTATFDQEVNLLPKFTGILIEVIEHMPLEAAKALMSKTLSYPGLNQLVVTTPNRDFNKHYLITNGFRHDDHHYELNEPEFKELINSLTPKEFQVKFINIGDQIEGIATTMAAIWEKK
jgi:2-polyprenyl-3-methyl-5-hydroxy-6-metoxy-1,4-benzoquinol methylase